jgi:RNA polymerase sigma-70 factor (ECF subfamily)
MTKILKDAKDLKDFEIIERILKGETDIYEEIIRRYNASLYKIGRSYNFNHQDTQDLMQDTYINAFYNLSNFKNLSSFKTWLIKIMLHNCYHKTQKASYKNEVVKEIIEENVPMFNQNKNSKSNTVENNELGLIIE